MEPFDYGHILHFSGCDDGEIDEYLALGAGPLGTGRISDMVLNKCQYRSIVPATG